MLFKKQFLLGSFFFLLTSIASATTLRIPPDLALETLSENNPSAFAPFDFTLDDFSIDWLGTTIPGVQVSFVPGTMMWARIADLIVLPRAQIKIDAPQFEGGTIKTGGLIQALSARGATIVPVALLSLSSNQMEIQVGKVGKSVRGVLEVHFKPKHFPVSTANTDASCSPFRVQIEEETVDSKSSQKGDWAYFGCRSTIFDGEKNKETSLELLVYWDGVGDSVKANGLPVSSSQSGLWKFRLRSDSQQLILQNSTRKITVNYFVPPSFKRGFVGAGVGPYSFSYSSSDQNVSGYTPLLTLYASYALAEKFRFVAFDATSFHAHAFYTDLGVYVHNESFRALDERLSFNLLLGAHMDLFQNGGMWFIRPGAPQGFEFVFRDAFLRRHNFSTGAFIYPNINEKLYYNVWGRFGKGSWFGEINYLAWREKGNTENVYSRSIGLTIGFPITVF